MFKCPDCGHENTPGIAFCDECGCDLSNVTGQHVEPLVPPTSPSGPVSPTPVVYPFGDAFSSTAPDPFGAAPDPGTPPSPSSVDPFGDPFAGTTSVELPAAPDATTPEVNTLDWETGIGGTGALGAGAPLTGSDVSPAASTSASATLTVERNGTKGRAFSLEASSLLGKWDMDAGIFPEVDLTDEDPQGYISRRHAQIENTGGAWTVTDLDSTNGTAVNRKKVPAQRSVPLSDGDELILGRLFLRFTVS